MTGICCYSSQLGLLPFAIPNPTFFLFFFFFSDEVDLYIKENEKDILTYSQCLHFPTYVQMPQ